MPRRPTEWFGWSVGDQVLGAAVSRTEVIPVADFDAFTKPTVTRIVGDLTFRLNHSGTVEFQATSLFVGIGVFDEDVTPNPQAELDRAGWMWVGSDLMGAPIAQDLYAASPRYDVQLSGYRKARFHVDIRAQRIVGPRQELLLCVYYADEVGTPDNPGMTGHLRCLIKE